MSCPKVGLKLPRLAQFSLGVTLIESLIVIAMVGLFLGLSIPAIRQFNANQTLKAAALGLKSDLRLAQDNAISGKRAESGPSGRTSCASDELLAGWYVGLSSYFTYDHGYQLVGLCVKKSDSSLGQELLGKRVRLPPGVRISKLQVGPNNPNFLVVFFRSSLRSASRYVDFLASACDSVSGVTSCPSSSGLAGGPLKIELSFGSAKYYVNVTSGGSIYESKN